MKRRAFGITVAGLLVGVLATCSPLAATGDVPVDRGEDWPIKPPLPIWPSDFETITERKPVFRLNGQFQASRYRVELARNAAFGDPVTITEARIGEKGVITPIVLAAYTGEPLADGQYYWRAFAGNDAGFWTPPANYRTFFVAGTDRGAIVPPSEPLHPRLLLRTDEIPALRARIQRSEHLQRGWQYQINTAFSTLDLDPPDENYAKAGEGQHGNYSTAASWYHRHLENVALVAAVTGNGQLAVKGVEMLMTACGYGRWLGPLFDKPEHFDPPWNAALETAMMTEAVAIGYDLLYPRLTDEQRKTVREALAEKGVRKLVHDWADPVGSSQIPRHQLPTGNWVMVCSGSAGIGALAMLGEQPEAAEWVRLVRNRTRAWFEDRGGDWYVDSPFPRDRPSPIPVIGPSEPNFGVDGGYKETIGYMNYGTRYACFFADALRRTTGEDLFAHVPVKLLDQMAWSIMARPADGGVKTTIVDFGDTGAGIAWYNDLLAVLVKNRGDARASWLYQRTVPAPLTPRSLLWFDERVMGAPPETAVPMGVFRGIGQVVMRSGWSPDTPMAAIKFHQNRGHLDIGTFYLYGAGLPTIIDSGVASYGSSIYGEYSSQSVAHNVVLVDGRAQARANGEMLAAVGTSSMTAAAGELRAAYPDALNSWTRDLVMMPGGVAIVHDRLEGKGQHRFDLILHPENPFRIKSLSQDSASRPAGSRPHTGPGMGPNVAGELSIGDETAPTMVSVLSDGAFNASEQDGYYTTLPRKYVRFNADAPAERRSFLTVCRWPTGRYRKPPSPTAMSAAAGQWRLDLLDAPGRWAIRTGDDAQNNDDWVSSDARLAAVWATNRRAPGLHAVVLAGKYLRVEGKELLRATAPINAAVEIGESVRAQFWASAPVSVTLAVDARARNIFLNGSLADGERSAGDLTLAIPAGQSELLVTELARYQPRLAPLTADDLLSVTVPDAPAYRPNVRTRASTSWSDGMDALDDDPNTFWASLPGVPVPQWLEVLLPRRESMSRIEIGTGLPCAGKVETWEPLGRSFRPAIAFETTAERGSATVHCGEIQTDRIRVTIERIDPANNMACIHSLRWAD